jgi:hypothetical protein
METLGQLYDPCLEGKLRGGCFFDEEGDRINQRVAMAIAGSSVGSRSIHVPHLSDEQAASKVRVMMMVMTTTTTTDR